PTILAFSKRVNFGGPTFITKPSKSGFFSVFFPDLEGVGTKGCLGRCYRPGKPRIKPSQPRRVEKLPRMAQRNADKWSSERRQGWKRGQPPQRTRASRLDRKSV